MLSRTTYRFAVVTVNYNSKDGLQKTINSIRAQSYKNYELIIIDNQSTDKSGELLKELKKDTRTTVVTEKDQGIYDAMNKGFRLAYSQHVIFLNAGDTFHSNDVLERTDSKISETHSLNCGDTFLVPNNTKITQKFTKYGVLKNICHQSIFYNTKLVQNPPFDTRYRICADFKTTLNSYIRDSINYTDITVANFDTTGISNRLNNQRIRERIEIIFKSELSMYAKALSIISNLRLLIKHTKVR